MASTLFPFPFPGKGPDCFFRFEKRAPFRRSLLWWGGGFFILSAKVFFNRAPPKRGEKVEKVEKV
jgi:hypothetical protein